MMELLRRKFTVGLPPEKAWQHLATQTQMTWVVEGSGFGISVMGRLFAAVYARDLDKAIPALVAEMNQQGSARAN